MYDIIIIGAGPAGLTAAVYARRANKTVLLLGRAAFGGQIAFSPTVETSPAFESISGSELADKMVEQVLSQGADVEIEDVCEIKDNGATKTVLTADGNSYECKSVIIAGGAKHRRLNVPNEEKFLADGISFCAVCDGAFYSGKEVILIGGGNSALQEAILLSESCKKVTVVQNLDFLTGEQKLQDILAKRDNVEVILGTVVEQVDDGDVFSSITVKKVADGSLSKLYADGMFLAIGLEPDNKAFDGIVELDKSGYVNADESCLTKTPGVFVAGDCRTKSVRQVTTASADGAVAAIAACRYIDAL